MILRFHPVPGHLASYPGPKRVGQLHHYIGRTSKPGPRGVAHVANIEPVELDTENAEQEKTARRFVKFVQRGGLYPADAATAKHCGVRFVKLERDGSNGEWRPVAAAEIKKPPSAQKRGKRDLNGASADHGTT